MKKLISTLILLIVFTYIQSPVVHASNWGFKRGENGEQADAGAMYNKLLEKYDAIYRGAPDKKVLYLTFDNGYENGYTEPILDTLKKQKVPAAFFLTGHYLESASDLVKRMVKEGHIIGNHSWGHLDYVSASDEEIKADLEKVKQKTKALTGQKEMKYLRTPRGTFDERVLALTKDLGYQNVFWSLAYVDWLENEQKGAQHAYDSIMKQIHPGAIIMLHSVSKDNAEALDKVIIDLKKQGYKFKSLDDFK